MKLTQFLNEVFNQHNSNKAQPILGNKYHQAILDSKNFYSIGGKTIGFSVDVLDRIAAKSKPTLEV